MNVSNAFKKTFLQTCFVWLLSFLNLTWPVLIGRMPGRDNYHYLIAMVVLAIVPGLIFTAIAVSISLITRRPLSSWAVPVLLWLIWFAILATVDALKLKGYSD